MTNKELKVPRVSMDEDNLKPPEELPRVTVQKRPRTSEDFYLFCTYVLEYVNYDQQRNEQEVLGSRSPPLDSSGSSVNSESTNSGQEDKPSSDDTDNDGGDSHDLVTCYCGKPFAGRPMIECTSCLIWIHLSCARIRKTHIPEVFYCAVCKGQQQQQSPPSSPSASLKRMKRAPLSPV